MLLDSNLHHQHALNAIATPPLNLDTKDIVFPAMIARKIACYAKLSIHVPRVQTDISKPIVEHARHAHPIALLARALDARRAQPQITSYLMEHVLNVEPAVLIVTIMDSLQRKFLG